VAERLGEPDGIIACDPSSFPKRGTHAVGVQRQWCSHRGKVDNCQVGVFMGYVLRHAHAVLDCRLSLPEDWAWDAQRRAAETWPRHPLPQCGNNRILSRAYQFVTLQVLLR